MPMMSSMKTPVGGLALLSFALYTARAVVAGISFNDRLNAVVDGSVGELSDDENAATPILVQTTLIVSMIGVASSFAGMLHVKEWNDASRLVGVGVGMIACILDFLVMGYAVKQWEIYRRDDVTGTNDLSNRSQFIAAAAVAQVVLQLIYLAGIYKSHPEDKEVRIVKEAEENADLGQGVEHSIEDPSRQNDGPSGEAESDADEEVVA